mgnify:FL=1
MSKSKETKDIQEIKENKMGMMPINRLLINMALPMMISMLVQALYNVVDSIYVAQLSEDALTAVSLAFPMQNLMIAVAVGTGVGVNTLISRSLGAEDRDMVSKATNNGLLLAFLSTIVFMIIGFTLSRTYIAYQTDIPQIIADGTQYTTIVCGASVGLFTQILFERLVQATGRTYLAMISQTAGAVVNIVLDPILIFGYFGLPAMGVAGAAIATVIGQIFGAQLGLIFCLKCNPETRLSLKDMLPCADVIKKIYKVGVPSILMSSIGSVMTYCMNMILSAFSSTAVAVFGIYFKLQSFVFMPVFGLNNGMVPIIAFNHGAKNPKRIYKTVRLSMIYATGMMLIGFALFQIIPGVFLSMFDASQQMLRIGDTALRIISISFIFAGFNLIASSVFQALDASKYSMLISIARQLIVLIPIAFALAKLTGSVHAVWFAFPIAEALALLACIFYLKRVLDKKVKPLQQEKATV